MNKDDTLEWVGKILPKEAKRDAVHFAVAPVIAGEDLRPGVSVHLVDGLAFAASNRKISVGIVDPFLEKFVQEKERFFVFLNPNTITNMRHVWEHPAFPSEVAVYSKEKSEEWLRDFANTHDCPEYNELISKALMNEDPDYLHINGTDAHGTIPVEFWDHLENLTEKEIVKRPKYFSCSC